MTALRPEEATMSPAEAEAIVARLAARDEGGALSVAEVAEALRLSPEEVARLLAEVRAAPLGATKPKRRTLRRERRVWLLSGLLAVVLLISGLIAASTIGWGALVSHGAEPRPIPSSDAYDLFLDGRSFGIADWNASEPREGLAEAVVQMLDGEETQGRGPNPTGTAAEAQRARMAATAHQWGEVPDLRLARLEIRRPDSAGHAMHWADAEVPVYTGNEAHVAEIVRRERARLVADAIESARRDATSVTEATTRTP